MSSIIIIQDKTQHLGLDKTKQDPVFLLLATLSVSAAHGPQTLISGRFLSIVTLSKFGFYQFLASDLEMSFLVKHVFTRYADW